MAPARDDSRNARYVLGVLVLVYVFNFLDRQIVSILAERIKADLGTTDAQMGFPLRHRVRRLLRRSSASRSAAWPTSGTGAG
jgi:hypothetical protein